jgi:predicted O-methyltransferase YrrM
MKPEWIVLKLGARRTQATLEAGRICYDLVRKNRLYRCLQLGFRNGVSSAYIAGALQDMGQGSLLAVERLNVAEPKPNIENVIEDLMLSDFVEVQFEPRCFNWHLMKLLENGQAETFDFCYIDGQRTWDTDGFAYCLASRLLRPGGWLVINNLIWTFQEAGSAEWARALPEDDRNTAQVGRVYELLMRRDPFFACSTKVDGRIAIAQKTERVWTREKPLSVAASAEATGR